MGAPLTDKQRNTILNMLPKSPPALLPTSQRIKNFLKNLVMGKRK